MPDFRDTTALEHEEREGLRRMATQPAVDQPPLPFDSGDSVPTTLHRVCEDQPPTNRHVNYQDSSLQQDPTSEGFLIARLHNMPK